MQFGEYPLLPMFYGSLLALFVADLVTELWALWSLIQRVKCGPFLEFYWLAVHLWVVFFWIVFGHLFTFP
jgi:hypothetical protein